MTAPARDLSDNPFAKLANQSGKPATTSAPVKFPPTAEQQDIVAAFNRGENMVISAGAGTGKALRDDQLVQTPNGAVTIATLRVGDEVIGSKGTPVKVTGVYPQGVRPLFEVTTCDGVSIVADSDHRWKCAVSSPSQGGGRFPYKVYTTAELVQHMTVGGTPILPMMSAPAHTYHKAGVGTTASRDDFHGLTNAPVDIRVEAVKSLVEDSLVGNMATAAVDEAHELAEVVRSLGGTAEIRKERGDGTVPVRIVCPAAGIGNGGAVVRRIVSIEPVAPASATCISVDAPDKLFATEGYVLTHNTSTITLLAEEMYKSDPRATGVYLSFNKDIATEVGGKFFYGNVQAMTVHSLANRAIRANPRYASLMDKIGVMSRIKVWEMPKEFGVPKSVAFGETEGKIHPKTNPVLLELTGQTICKEAQETIKRWCMSADDRIHPKHVPLRIGKFDQRVRRRYRECVAEVAQRMWDTDLMSPNGGLYFTHDHYLKLYMISSPSLSNQLNLQGRRSVLFFDEAQDVRPCMARLVREQQDMQLVVCGDSSQAIYQFTGARDSIKGFKALDTTSSYTLSSTFRFGPNIAAVANQVLDLIKGSDVRIVPDLSIPSEVVSVVVNGETSAPRYFDKELAKSRFPEAIICFSNIDVMNSTIALLQEGVKVYASIDVNRVSSIAEDWLSIEKGEKPHSYVMRQFKTVDDIRRFLGKAKKAEEEDAANTDEEVEIVVDETLVPFLNVIDRVGAATVITAMSRVQRSETGADVIVSTIHKSKGRQWNSVFINWELGRLEKIENKNKFNDNLMLLYVAITRARKALILDDWLFSRMKLHFPLTAAPKLSDKYMDAAFDGKRDKAISYAMSFDPHVPVQVIEDMLENDIPPHKMVQAIVYVQDKFLSRILDEEARHVEVDKIRGAVMAFLAEVGIANVFEVMNVADDNDLPVELIGAMLPPRGITDDPRVHKMLDPS